MTVRRLAEDRALADLLDSASGEAAALVIDGEAGIGKTTLWLDGIGQARERGFQVLTARAAEADSVLAYTGLADLLGAVAESTWGDLPAPQRRALDAALLRGPKRTRAADPRAVAAAFVAVVGGLAAAGPLVIAIDDLQWLDTSSAKVMSFAARRLPDGVVVLFTARSEGAAAWPMLPNPDTVHRITLQPLTVGEVHQVLTARLGISLARPTLLRIHEIAGGNPFYALELVREMNSRGTVTHPGLPGSLAELVHARISRVSAGAGDALLAIASVANPTVQLVADATDMTVDHLMELLDDAAAHDVVAVDGNRVRFTHPILAHGVYGGALPHRRRAMHRRLAELETEPELRARHLALYDATGEPQTLQALDIAADIAHGRGAPSAAAELLELAMGLGADTEVRRIRCASCYFFAGDPHRARALLEASIEQLPSGSLRAEALNQLAVVRLYDDSFVEASELLERGLRECGDDTGLRVRILVSLSFARLNAGQPEPAYLHAREAVTAAEPLGLPNLTCQALGMRAMLEFLRGEGFDDAALHRAVQLEEWDPLLPLAFRPTVQLALLLAWTGELDTAREQMMAVRRRCVAHGEEGELIFVGFHLVLIDVWRGDLQRAAVTADETMDVAVQLGGDFPLFIALTVRAMVAAYAGRPDETRRDLQEAIAAGRRCSSLRLAEWPITLHGFLEVSLGNYQGALAALEPVLPVIDAWPDATEIVSASFAPDAAEALISLGRFDEAEQLVGALERNGLRLDRAWMRATGARCRAMLLAAGGDVEAATAMVNVAMAQHNRLPMPFERARTQLLLGQLERRRRRREASKAALGAALDTFERFGMQLWAARARAELALGSAGRRRADGLTPAEQRVADLAAKGLSNHDIAAALFITPKTVEVNLSRIYRKLDIHSRIELYRVISGTT